MKKAFTKDYDIQYDARVELQLLPHGEIQLLFAKHFMSMLTTMQATRDNTREKYETS